MRRLARASSIGVANPTSSLGGPVDAALDTLATALYVTTDDLLKTAPHLAPWRAAADLILQVIRALASDTTFWTDDVWVADSTPVECGRSTQTVHRSELAGWAEYGYCASHSRYFWGLRLHLVCTLQGLPVGFALSGAKADEREVLLGILAADPALLAQRPGQTLIADKN